MYGTAVPRYRGRRRHHATLGALRHALRLFAGSERPGQATALGAIVALAAVFATGAEAVVGALDQKLLRPGDATLVGLRLLATDMTTRLGVLAKSLSSGKNLATLLSTIADLEATLSIAAGPRLARQTRLGEMLIHG
jgi:hypothetical protein